MKGFGICNRRSGGRRAILGITAGLVGSVVTGVVLKLRRAPGSAEGARDYARDVAERLRPARVESAGRDQETLTALEDAVLGFFLEDEVLRERGVDVGAIGEGIIELSGSVYTHEETERAAEVARRAEGVVTVVNRLEVTSEAEHLEETRRRHEEEGIGVSAGWEGRGVGMGRMRQGAETEPDRPDDSKKLRDRALAETDTDEQERIEAEMGRAESVDLTERSGEG